MSVNIATVSGSFTATGQSTTLCLKGAFNLTLSNTFVGTVKLERSFDNTLWSPVTDEYGTAYAWTVPMTIIGSEPESGVLYRLNCTAYTSGDIDYRISQ